MEIPKSLNDEIWNYCRLNNIPNIEEFTIKLLKQGFTIEKFGATPTPKEIIVEKIIEKIIEVPVEKIVEVPMATISTELSENQKNFQLLYEESQLALQKAISELGLTKEQLGIEQNKKKNDLYGEN